MALTLDTTTQAEYSAAATAQLRAEAVRLAMQGSITVGVYDAGDNLMGSGTMPAPFGTRSSKTLTVGEVTSFSVTSSGTPDSDWYIKWVAANGRFVRGSFGVAGSGQDFTWSNPTWELGQTGTLGTITMIAAGPEAPVFDDASTSASLPSSGGTIQFTATDPNGDAVTYSLPTTRTGITINPTTGLVTVAATAAGTSGDIVVRASDGKLFTDTTCKVNVASLSTFIAWHPGHYLATPAQPTSTEISTVIAQANSRSYIRGVVIRIDWGDLESSTAGTYTFGVINTALAALNTGKYLWLHIQTTNFETSSTDYSIGPAYLRTAAYDNGFYYDATDRSMITKIWNAAVMGRKIALIQALGTAYNNHAKFEGIVAGETAMGLTLNEGGSGYSPVKLTEQLERLAPAARAAIPKKNLLQYVNFVSGTSGSGITQDAAIVRILAACRANDWCVGGPDSKYLSPLDARLYMNGTLGSVTYKGKIGIQVGDQFPGMTEPSYVAANLITTAVGWGMNYGFWQYIGGTNASILFTPMMTYLSNNPAAYVATYPSEFT